MHDPSLDGCHCCEGLAAPDPVRNDPGLPALRYRIDTWSGFYQRMLQRLPLVRAGANVDIGTGAADSPRPLARLLARNSDDPTVALLDACACMADVLSFYQERIANEGFLRTATERRSVLELARAIGYELTPGVAAGVHLAFSVEDAPGAPGVCRLAQGTPVQSVPPQGKLPQVFETSTEIEARAQWNALIPRQARPADLALVEVPTVGENKQRLALVLLTPVGSFPDGTPNLIADRASKDLFRLDHGLPVEPRVDALEVGRVYFTTTADGITGGITGGDLLLFCAKRGSDLATLVLRVVGVVAEPDGKRVRVDLEPLPEPGADPSPPPGTSPRVPYAKAPITDYGAVLVSPVSFTRSSIAKTLLPQPLREHDLQATIALQGWNAKVFEQAFDPTGKISASDATRVPAPAQPGDAPAAPETGAFAFEAKLGFFGHNAPKWGSILPPNALSTPSYPYKKGWDEGDLNFSGGPRTIWQDSQGNTAKDSQGKPIPPLVYLERAVPNVTRASWVLFDSPALPAQPYTVLDARETSRADFGLSGRAMRLRLADASGTPLPPEPLSAKPPAEKAPAPFGFRNSTARVASRRLVLADLPIDVPIAAGTEQIELDRLVLGLSIGQPVALIGEQVDLPGIEAAEIALLADIVHLDGRSTLVLTKGIAHSYVRGSLKINANVVHATHGESVNELLGNGDASRANQSFVLKQQPTTYLCAPTASGLQSTLAVRVNGLLWDEVPSLYGTAPDQTVYMTRSDDDARMEITFGDGVQGARLPSGALNVAARYRTGSGPDGEVDAGTLTQPRALPLGLRGVTNPIPASGAAGPARLADARRNAPLRLLTFERVVSRRDYEDYARAYPGIGKARGDLLQVHGRSLIHLTVAGVTGGPPGADVLANLAESIGNAGDPSRGFLVAACARRYFSCSARVAVDARYVADEVRAAVAAALRDGFGFAARDPGQSVTAAEVVTLIQSVTGVVAVDLDALLPYTDQPPPVGTVPNAVSSAVPAFGARWDAAREEAIPAQLLLINPAGIDILEMTL